MVGLNIITRLVFEFHPAQCTFFLMPNPLRFINPIYISAIVVAAMPCWELVLLFFVLCLFEAFKIVFAWASRDRAIQSEAEIKNIKSRLDVLQGAISLKNIGKNSI